MTFDINCEYSHDVDGYPVLDVHVEDKHGSVVLPVHVKTITTMDNPKTRKGEGKGYMTIGVPLSPHKTSGEGNACTNATKTCIRNCLDVQGIGSIFKRIHAYRAAKTWLYYNRRALFYDMVLQDIERAARKAKRDNVKLACRPNMFSDIAHERSREGIKFLERVPRECQLYDYTKHHYRFDNFNRLDEFGYHLTYSHAEKRESITDDILNRGHNVAVVFNHQNDDFPTSWRNHPVISGDDSDLRFLDRSGGYVIGLRMKYATLDSAHDMIRSGFAVTVPGCTPLVEA